MRYTFRGGIHPPGNKGDTKDKAIKTIIPPELIVIPLKQHIGAMLEPLVKVGETVKKGQKLGDSDAFISAPVHSSVSGKVKSIEPYFHPTGIKTLAVLIENDGKDEIYEEIQPIGEYERLTKEQIIKAVRNAGIVGMGGAAFPTHVKLSPPVDKTVSHIIINGSECEPYLTSDHRVMIEQPNDVIYGLKAVKHVFSLKKGYIAIEDNKKEAIKKLSEATENDDSIEIIELKTKYPQGSEKHLIKAVTGKEVPSGKLPADVGVIVLNIDTCTAITNVLKTGMPLIRRIVTVSGSGIKNPSNFEVSIGTDFDTVFKEAGGFTDDIKKIVMGGPMMGIAQYSLKTPVIKGTSGLIALSEKDAASQKEMPCLRCGKCVSACPMGLMPLYLSMYSKKEEYSEMQRYGVQDCIECGSCSFVCPSKKSIVQAVRLGKEKILANKGGK